MTVKKSSKDNYFFSHRPNCGHDIRPETLLHKLAILWFIDKEEYEFPSYDLPEKKFKKQVVRIDKSETKCEFRQLQKIIPDVKLTTVNDFHFAIEIVVTNDINESKIKIIKEFNLPTIRVDLTKFYKDNSEKCRVDFDFIQANLTELLNDINLKKWTIQPEYELIKEKFEFSEANSNNGFLTALAGISIFLLIRKFLK